jgi:hypothetical protein
LEVVQAGSVMRVRHQGVWEKRAMASEVIVARDWRGTKLSAIPKVYGTCFRVSLFYYNGGE